MRAAEGSGRRKDGSNVTHVCLQKGKGGPGRAQLAEITETSPTLRSTAEGVGSARPNQHRAVPLRSGPVERLEQACL